MWILENFNKEPYASIDAEAGMPVLKKNKSRNMFDRV
jgi:hypothetical protein